MGSLGGSESIFVPFIPSRLKQLREAKGLTQEALEALSQVNHSQIAKYENGKSRPGSNSLEKLTAALDASSDYLYGRGFKNVKPDVAAAQMAFAVFTEREGADSERVARCQRALLHADAPRTAQGWRAFAEMLEMVVGTGETAPTSGTLTLVSGGKPLRRKRRP